MKSPRFLRFLLPVLAVAAVLAPLQIEAGDPPRGRTVVVLRQRPLAVGSHVPTVRRQYSYAPRGYQHPRLHGAQPGVSYRYAAPQYYGTTRAQSVSMARAQAAAYGVRYRGTPYIGNYGYGVPHYSYGYGHAIPSRGYHAPHNGYVGGLQNLLSNVIQIPHGGSACRK
jgi:hypothetical protein